MVVRPGAGIFVTMSELLPRNPRNRVGVFAFLFAGVRGAGGEVCGELGARHAPRGDGSPQDEQAHYK